MHEVDGVESMGSRRKRRGGVEFTLQHSKLGRGGQRDWRRRYVPYVRATSVLGSCRRQNFPGAFTRDRDRATSYVRRRRRVDHGGVAIIRREEEGWGVEGVRRFGPNVVIFTVTSGQKRWYVVGAYVPPNDLPTVHWITHALACGTERVEKLLVGDINACLENLRDQRGEHLATVLAGHGLTDQARHFVPRRRYRAEGNWTWRIWIEGRPVLGLGGYILWTT